MVAFERQCRICQETEPDNELISPCQCRGFSRFVHRDCLAEWRRRNVNQSYFRCEVCHFQYQYYRLRYGKFLESAWTSGGLSVVVILVAIVLSGQISARSCNAIWHYFMHQGPSLLPHRLQVLFHGLVWVSLPGWYFLIKSLFSGALQQAEFPRDVNVPITIYNWPSSSRPRPPPPSPKSATENKEEEERVTKYESPSTFVWLFVLAAVSVSFYKLFSKIHDMCRTYCLRCQGLIENI